MEPIKNFRYSYGNLPQEIEKNIYSFNCKKCELAFLASIDGNGKWATDIEDLKFCPHCGAKLYFTDNENRTIRSENRTIHSE